MLYDMPDISAVEYLHGLRYLALNRTGRTGLNFAAFPTLISLSLDWRPKSESMFGCSSLEELNVSGLPGPTLDELSQLQNLSKLSIAGGGISKLSGRGRLSSVRELGLYYITKLTDLDGIENLRALEVLDVETCKKIDQLDQISNLVRLKQLTLANCGDIASIKPIRNLKNLETVHFWESTNILDGGLSPLAGLPNLQDVRFKNRKHYSLRCEQSSPFGANPEYPKK